MKKFIKSACNWALFAAAIMFFYSAIYCSTVPFDCFNERAANYFMFVESLAIKALILAVIALFGRLILFLWED